ncbi:MAG: FtsQ-type POTRA domain-containing protein [Candidatus Omnitrophica bacterium]|nr:FtsQ-type POTRA domain-containing protein [Candidatus Omnitrophota bacterium]
MAKKSGVNISMISVLRVIVFLIIGYVVFSGYVLALDFLTNSPLFEVKDVMIDRSIQFIDLRVLKQLKGSNIFKVDIKKIDRQISQEYPYISQLRVVRQLPDRIMILAKKREPLLQIYFKGRFLLVDREGVALYYSAGSAVLPQVQGIPLERTRVVLGTHIRSKELKAAVDILNMFGLSVNLKRWKIMSMEVGNLSKIDLAFGDNKHVILDQDDTKDKIDLLQMLIAGNKIDLNKVKYIDLRFKEPVIADNFTDVPKG